MAGTGPRSATLLVESLFHLMTESRRRLSGVTLKEDAPMGGSDEEKFDHPTQKPIDLMRRPILNHTKVGESVYDPFLGSGTTLAAAEQTQRVCYGLELDPKYADVMVERWQGLSGKKATLDGTGRTFEDAEAQRIRRAA